MSRPRRGRFHIVSTVAFLLGLVLLLSCQPAQPVPLGTPKPVEKAAEKAVATATKPAEKPVRGGTLRITATGDPITFDPATDTSGDLALYDSLIGRDWNLDVTKEGLVKDWTVSADGKTMTLKLREGIKFHDGTDFDAAAVKFNIERVQDPATKSPYRTDYAAVKTVEIVDGLTVRLNLSASAPLLLPAMSAKGGLMVSPAAVKKYGQDFPRNPVGTGPFRFVEWVSSDHVTYKRFEGYWGKDKDGTQLPYLEQVVKRIVSDGTVAFANLRTGQVDFFGNLTAEQLPTLKSDSILTYSVRMAPPFYGGILLNTKKPPFDNKALRQAVALALDRQGMAARMGEEASGVAASVLHPMTWAYDEKVGRFPDRDLAKAKAKMAEAGYAGGLKAKMPLETGTSTGAPFVAQIAKANLAEIGLEVEIEALASGAFFPRVRVEMNYGIATGTVMGQGLADPGYILGQTFHSQGSRNYYGPYSNPQVDQLLDKAGSIYDQKERTALYREVSQIIADEVPLVPTYVTNYINGMSKKVRDYVHHSDNYMRLQGIWLAP